MSRASAQVMGVPSPLCNFRPPQAAFRRLVRGATAWPARCLYTLPAHAYGHGSQAHRGYRRGSGRHDIWRCADMILRAGPATRRLRRTIAVAGAALLAALGLAVAGGAGAVPAVAATSSCAAAYSVPTDWGSGFTANLNITDNGTTAITGWTVTYTYAGSQTLANGWNGTWAQSGKTVTVTNLSYNGSLAAGAST